MLQLVVRRPSLQTAGLPWHVCNRARLARDKSFDGVFFIAVSTTRIYCRPVCPSRHSRDDRVSFYFDAKVAEAAGFRACKRCRPDAARGSPAWIGTRATVRRGMKFIEAGFLDSASVGDLADKLGVGKRHLTRLFAEHVGKSPSQMALDRRLKAAVRLLQSTSHPIAVLAFEAGFSSLRRFNQAFQRELQRTPSSYRSW
jgi:AraC family transcriptional regulator, regulatory protein of adaptative response / methylated-DNA-[protein]-cysteine methyltransferase